MIPAVLLKLQRAKETGKPPVFWGTGKPRREFLYALDMAKVVLWAIEHYEDPQTLIVAPPQDEAIDTVVRLLSKYVGYYGPVQWDTSKPDGRLTRQTDKRKFLRLQPYFLFTPLPEGLREVAEHFQKTYPNLRGLKTMEEIHGQR